MGLKTILFFLSTCFAVLVSLQAIADDFSSPERPEVTSVIEGQKETIQSPDNIQEAPKTCEEESKVNKQKQNVPENEAAIKNSTSGHSNLSFNFIYYILYKFKYIDSLGLSTSEKPRSPKNQENLVWH